MANARVAYSPGRDVHEPDVIGPVSHRAQVTPLLEDRTGRARVELDEHVVVLAFRCPCELGPWKWRPAVGTGESPQPPVAPTDTTPGRKEPPVRAVLLAMKLIAQPSQMSKPHAGRSGWPGADVEHAALVQRDHRPAVERGRVARRSERGGEAGAERAGIGDRPAVDQSRLDHQRGAHVVLEVGHRLVAFSPRMHP